MRAEMIKNAPKQLITLFKALCNYGKTLVKYKQFITLFKKTLVASHKRIKALMVSSKGISFLKHLLRNESLFANSS